MLQFILMKMNKGFTLIELLVVIAVIGILAAVGMYAASSSRNKGIDSTIKANMRTISQQVELQFLNVYPGMYGTVNHGLGSCVTTTAGDIFADETIQKAVSEITRLSGVEPTCASTSGQWAVSALLKSPEGANTHWCIETEGKAKSEPGSITGTFCP